MEPIEDQVRRLLSPDPHLEIVADVTTRLHGYLKQIRADANDDEEAPMVVLLVATNKRSLSHVAESPLTTWWQERAIAACMEFVNNAYRRKWGGKAA